METNLKIRVQPRADIVGTAAKITLTNWRLRTVTGDPATIRGETSVTIVTGNVSFEHRALVAEIEDELILGMDVMNTKGFELDFKNSVLKINEDTAVSERSEMILDARLDGKPCDGNIMVFEPRSHDGEVARGIAVGKALSVADRENNTDQENDPNLRPIVDWKKEGRKPTWEEVSRYSPTVKSYWAQWNSLVLSDGVLKRVLEKTDGTEERKQLIVPRNRVPEVLEEIHTGGHLGVTKTLGKVRERFNWVNCTTVVKEWCKKCVVSATTYRSSVHETTGQTHASIVMGRELRLPCDLKFGCTPGDDVAGEDYVSTLRQRMDDIHE
ncbi:hypothetical protein NQ318_008097 [Aromia moschata]|uniref:RNA-directed DNA polymerase n=1 Tax=Aromia moschata TaxID=1265417 RepID=A0AAV8YPH3_9CUCU|nr:hypothetical protein NQ318_008097 [Aromia moschata]